MSTDVRTVTPSTGSEEAMCLMQTYGMRHLPVCEAARWWASSRCATCCAAISTRSRARRTSMRAYIQTSSS